MTSRELKTGETVEPVDFVAEAFVEFGLDIGYVDCYDWNKGEAGEDGGAVGEAFGMGHDWHPERMATVD